MDVIFIIGIIMIFIAGTLGTIYEYFIWDKSVIPSLVTNLTMIIGYLGLAVVIVWYIWQKKQK